MAAEVELSVVCMDSEICEMGIKFFFAHKRSNLALIKMPNFKYMSVLFDFGDHFPWHTQFAQYTWIAKEQNCAY